MNFVQTMRTAGAGNAVYPTQQAAIESVGLSIFFVDRMVKDRSSADRRLDSARRVVAGAASNRPYAGRSKANLRANLDGLRRIAEGCDAGYAGFGFDDLLESVGAAERRGPAARDGGGGRGRAGRDRGAGSARGADGRTGLRCEALRDAIGAITTFLKTELYTLLDFEESVIPTDTDA